MSDFAFVSLLATDDYLIPVMMLYNSWKDTASIADFLILATDNLSQDTFSFLDRYNISYTVVPNFTYKISEEWTDNHELVRQLKRDGNQLALEQHYKNNRERTKKYETVMNRLYCFGLTQYKKVISLDGDMIFLDNCDELFDFEFLNTCLLYPNIPESIVSTIFGCKPLPNFHNILFKKAKQSNFDWTDEAFFRLIFSNVRPQSHIDLETYCPILAKKPDLNKSKMIHYLLTAAPVLAAPRQTIKTLPEVISYWNIDKLTYYYNKTLIDFSFI